MQTSHAAAPAASAARLLSLAILALALTWLIPQNAAFSQVSAPDSTGDASTAEPFKPAPPSNLKASPVPNKAGRSLNLSWDPSPDDDLAFDPPRIQGYRLYRARAAEENPRWVLVQNTNDLPPTVTQVRDEGKGFRARTPYLYRLVAVSADGVESDPAELDQPASGTIYLFDRNKGWFLVLTLIVSAGITFYIYLARTGVDLKIRKIAGLEAVDEAVGRATEMGRSILFVPGIQDMNNIQTVAGITVLSHIGQMAAEYDAKIEVPTARSLVMTTARETLESAYLAAGRPDAYHDDLSYYVTDEQFGYVAYLTGYMVREEPAACFYLGAFYAESLILAETGNSIGAIQVAGTAEPAQLPFFVAACDYTLIGEEFFAASAYLSGEPEQLGTLKGQDFGKVVGALLILVGCVLATMAHLSDNPTLNSAVEYLQFRMLGIDEPPTPDAQSDQSSPADPAETETPAGNDQNADQAADAANAGPIWQSPQLTLNLHLVPQQDQLPRMHPQSHFALAHDQARSTLA